MAKTTNTENFGGPLQNAYENYLQGAAPMLHGLEPLMRAWARGNLEMMTLMSRRARSYLELPERLQNCRSPQDLAGEQMRFWQDLYKDYVEGAQRLTDAWGSMMRQTVAPPNGDGERDREVSFHEADDKRSGDKDRSGGRRAA